MKKQLLPLTIVLSLILLLMLAACGGEATPATEAPAPPSEPAAAEAEADPTLTPTAAEPTEAPAEPTSAPAETEVILPESPPAEPTTEPEAEAEAAQPVSRSFQIVPAESQASYAVEEEFFNRSIDFFTAIGVTNDISGSLTLLVDDGQVTLGDNTFVVDLRTLQSDSERRDDRIRREWLESNSYPLAEFSATELVDFPAQVTEGESIDFTLAGDMTIRDITNPVTFDTTARLDGGTLSGSAVTNLLMVDYGFEPPNILDVLKVTDGVTVTVEFVAGEINQP